MIVRKRDKDLKYPKAIKNDKMLIVLDWLLEFRFSSIELMSVLLESNTVNQSRFFKSLVDDGVIQVFQNVHTKNERYIMLTGAGLSYLEAEGRDVSRAVIRAQQLGRYAQVMHDIAVQRAAMRRLSSYVEIIWDKNIVLEGVMDRPDLMLKNEKGYWVALEYERWRKDQKRVCLTFVNHARSLEARSYMGVYYLFDKEVDLENYKKIFSMKEWPLYARDKRSGRVKAIEGSYKPDSVKNLRNCFAFLHEPVENTKFSL